jgi:hypothetical protein
VINDVPFILPDRLAFRGCNGTENGGDIHQTVNFGLSMQERFAQIEDGWLFVRHSELRRLRSVLLFVHGLGESGPCFRTSMNVHRIMR